MERRVVTATLSLILCAILTACVPSEAGPSVDGTAPTAQASASTSVAQPGTATPAAPAQATVTAPLPSPTPAPATSATPTATPAPDIASIITAALPVIAGQGVPGAARYDPGAPGPHPVVILSSAGAGYRETEETSPGHSDAWHYDWNENLPTGWSPASIGETELVVVIGPQQEFNLGSQAYNRGPNISAYRYEVEMELREARTGRVVATYRFKGSDPRPFPETAPVGQTRLEGSHLQYTDFEEWLCPSVMPHGCWTPLPELQATGLNDLAFSPDGQTLALGTYFEGLQLWKVSDGTVLRSWAPEGWVEAPAEGSAGPEVVVLGAESGDKAVGQVDISPDGQILAVAMLDGRVQLLRMQDGSVVRTLAESADGVDCLAFSADGQMLAAATVAGSLQVWQISDGTLLSSQAMDLGYRVRAVVFSPDGQTVTIAAANGSVQLREVGGGALLQTLELGFDAGRQAISPDGQTVAAGSNNRVQLWRVSDGTLLRSLEAQTSYEDSRVTAIAFSADGQVLVVEVDGTVQLWQASDGKVLRTLLTRLDTSAAFSPDMRTLALVHYGEVWLWSLAGQPGSMQPAAIPAGGARPGRG
jgi:outer membrane protein assembly factor BamB